MRAAVSRRSRASAIEADARRPAGSRIVSVKVGDAPLDEGRTYRVATNDFLLRGGDGYTAFRDAKPLLPADDSPLCPTTSWTTCVKLGTVRTGVEGRIVLEREGGGVKLAASRDGDRPGCEFGLPPSARNDQALKL